MIIKFNLNVSIEAAKLCKQDSLFVIGSTSFLGSWNLSKAIEMKLKNDDSLPIFSTTSNSSLCFPENAPELNSLDFEAVVNVSDKSEVDASNNCIHYKYFVAQKTSQGNKVFLKQIENGWRKMTMDPSEVTLVNDKWPYYEGDDGRKPARVDLGWLLKDENEIQFHFYDNPLQLWNVEKDSKNQYAIEFKPMKAQGLIELKDYTLSHLDFDEQKYQNGKMNEFNAFNDPNVYSSFRFRSFEQPTNIIFQLNIYELKSNGSVSDKLVATSYYKVNKALTENCLIDIDLSLLKDQQVVGSLKAEICMITSIKEEANSTEISEHNYSLKENFRYDYSRSCLSIGHRGMGKSFDGTLDEISFIENTIESFNEAFMRGADMVEFDIVLTKDKIPIIYHDFQFCINNTESDDTDLTKYIDISVNQMTYQEIKKSRIYSHCVRGSPNSDSCTSKSMFPTLKEMCEQLDTKLGFNVELKYPQDIEDNLSRTEIGRFLKWLNRNEYADVILKELYNWVNESRLVILSTFDPLLCSILRMKQNKFPVLFLTTGITARWIPYKDFRCKNTKISVNFAKSEGIHGIVAHTEEISANDLLMQDLFIGSDLKTTNFLRIAWGEELNEQNKRKLYKKTGLNGIIYDRIHITHKDEMVEDSGLQFKDEEIVQSVIGQSKEISVQS